MGSAQTETYEFEKLMSNLMSKIEPLWAGRSTKTVLSERIPIVIAANTIIDSLTEFIMVLTGDPNSPEFHETVFNESMGKFKISRHTFGMEEEKLVRRDICRLTKPIINRIKSIIFSDSNRYPVLDLRRIRYASNHQVPKG